MAYLPVGKTITIDVSSIPSKRIRGWWFNPKNAETKQIGRLRNKGEMQFTPPILGTGNDWVLVIDNDQYKYRF